MTRVQKNNPLQRKISYAVFRYKSCALSDLERGARKVVPPPLMPRVGKSETRIFSHYAGRCAAAVLLAKQSLDAFVVPNSAYGFLQIADANYKIIPEQFLNISHTRDIAVAVLGPSPVGIDIEACARPISRRVLERVSLESELNLLKDEKIIFWNGECPSPVALWSSKEAVSKAVGLGLKFGMKVFEIGLSPSGKFPVTIKAKGPFHLHSPMVQLLIDEEYAITICAETEILKRGLRKIEVTL